MSLFSNIFKNKKTTDAAPPLPPRFGRYTDAYKTPAQLAAWSKAVAAYEGKGYVDSFAFLMEYLSDPQEANVEWELAGDGMRFSLLQGSKRIDGLATERSVKAWSEVVKCGPAPGETLLQHLLERNFSFRHCRFSTAPTGEICLRFETSSVDASPHKLFYALRELATLADDTDDLLCEKFPGLYLSPAPHVSALPPEEVAVKIAFLKKWIAEALSAAEGVPEEQKGYFLMSAVYRAEYLLTPQGFMAEKLAEMDAIWQQEKNAALLIERLVGGLNEIYRRSDAQIEKEFYRTKSTFGVSIPAHHERLAGLIYEVIGTMGRFEELNSAELVCAISEATVGQFLCHYASPQPLQELFHLYMQVMSDDYFTALGYPAGFHSKNGHLVGNAISSEIQHILKRHQEQYPRLVLLPKSLDFSTKAHFAGSFLRWVRLLNLYSPNKS